jgi:hypothetical protein
MLNVSFVFVGYENGRPYWESTQYGMKIVWTGVFWTILYWPYDGTPINYTDTDIPLTGWELIDNTSLTATFSVNLGECCFVYSYLNDVLDSTLTIKYIDCNYNSQNITAEYGESGSFCAVSIEFSNNTGSYSLTGDLCPPEPSPSITPSISITPSTTPSITPSISISVTPSITPSVTPSISISVTPSTTPSITPSTTPSISISVTPSVTPSISISVTPSTTPSITPSPSSSNLFEALISTTSDPSDACSLSLVDTVWIEGNFNRVFTDAGGTIPFNGGNAYWHMQKLTDVVSRSQDIDTNGYPINPAALCP